MTVETDSSGDWGEDRAESCQRAIARLPYWGRAWVHQELAFAKHHLLQCQRTKIETRSWIQLERLFEAKEKSAIKHASVMEHRCWSTLRRGFSKTTALSLIGARLQPLQETLLSPAHRYETLKFLFKKCNLDEVDGRLIG